MSESTLELALVERDIGALPLSIGTSLAIESLFGIHPEQPKHPVNIKTIDELWINMVTLVRNLHSAVPTIKASSLDPNACVELLKQELDVLPVLMQQKGLRIKVVPYICPPQDVEYAFPKAEFKHPKTPKQIAYKYFEDYVTKALYELLKSEQFDFKEIIGKPKRANKTMLMLTHYPHELFWKDQFDRLLLLESHTGRIKPYNLWYTKLNGIKSNERPMPFNRFTLQVFGDGVLIEGQSRTIKGQLKQLVESRKWSPVTTQDKFYHDITTYGTKELIECYKLLR